MAVKGQHDIGHNIRRDFKMASIVTSVMKPFLKLAMSTIPLGGTNPPPHKICTDEPVQNFRPIPIILSLLYFEQTSILITVLMAIC